MAPNIVCVTASIAYGLRPGRVVKIVGVPSLTRGGSVRAAPVAGFRGHAVENTDESGGAASVSAIEGDDIAGNNCGLAVVGSMPISAGAKLLAVDEQFEFVVDNEVNVHGRRLNGHGLLQIQETILEGIGFLDGKGRNESKS